MFTLLKHYDDVMLLSTAFFTPTICRKLIFPRRVSVVLKNFLALAFNIWRKIGSGDLFQRLCFSCKALISFSIFIAIFFGTYLTYCRIGVDIVASELRRVYFYGYLQNVISSLLFHFHPLRFCFRCQFYLQTFVSLYSPQAFARSMKHVLGTCSQKPGDVM